MFLRREVDTPMHTMSRTSDIDMKLGRVTKLDKKNKTTSKNFLTSLQFFQFMANLEHSGSRISDAYSVKLMFPLTVTFYLPKTENRTKKSLTRL